MGFGLRRLLDGAALSLELETLLGDAPEPALLVGIEQEYRVVMRDDPLRRVDFRTMVHELGLGRRHLDPDDPHAYRLRSGNIVTCDGPEAEIVLAPVAAIAGAATSIVLISETER